MKANWKEFMDDDSASCIEIFLNDKTDIGSSTKKKYLRLSLENYCFIKPFDNIYEDNDFKDEFNANDTIDEKEKGAYDSVILNSCIEYIPDIIGFIIKSLRFIKRNGKVIFVNRDKRYSNTCIMPSSSFVQAYNIWKGEKEILREIIFDILFHLTFNYDKASYWNAYPVSDRNYQSIDSISSMIMNKKDGKEWFLPYWRFDMREFLFFIQGINQEGILCLELERIIMPSEYDNTYAAVFTYRGNDYIRNSMMKTQIQDEIRDAAYSLYNDVLLEENDIIGFYVDELRNWKEEYYRIRELYDSLVISKTGNTEEGV